MISAEDIGNFIENPTAIPKSQLEELSALCDKFPYSSTLHLLYLKGLSNHGDINFEEVLKRSAAHAVDREQLHAVIHGEDAIYRNEKRADAEESATYENEQVVEESVAETNQEAVEDIEEEIKKEAIEEEVVEEKIVEEDLLKEQIAAKETKGDVDLIETDIISAAATTAYEQETEELVEESTDEEIEAAASTTEKVIEENLDFENMTFIQWLNYKQGKPIKSKSDTDDLVNKFIQDEPSISKPSKKFYDPVESAKESLDESSELVSETLAKIHIRQQNFGKAIETYEQLMHLYPEKKAIFASRIEEINSRLKKK